MKITEDNFIQLAMNCYDNIQCCSLVEFQDDLKRFLYVKKLFTKYHVTGELRDRLILNHIIILCNVFNKHAKDFLFFKVEQDHWKYLATFLVYLNKIPEEELGNHSYDEKIIKALRKI